MGCWPPWPIGPIGFIEPGGAKPGSIIWGGAAGCTACCMRGVVCSCCADAAPYM